MLSRRGLIGGLVALAAPAIIRSPGLLMPIKPLPELDYYKVEWPYTHRVYSFGIYADEVLANIDTVLKGGWDTYKIIPTTKIISST